jgi:ribosomal subunit interface protein
MQVQPQITYRDVKHSAQVEEHIQSQIQKMERLSSHIVSCQVVLNSDTHHQHSDEHYQTSVKVLVPRKELVAKGKEENLYKSIDGAFDQIRRQLDDYDKQMNDHHRE